MYYIHYVEDKDGRQNLLSYNLVMRTKSPTWKESKTCWVNIIRHFAATNQIWPNVSSIITCVSFSQRLLFILSLCIRFSKTGMHKEWNTAYNPSMVQVIFCYRSLRLAWGTRPCPQATPKQPLDKQIIIIPRNFTCRENNLFPMHYWPYFRIKKLKYLMSTAYFDCYANTFNHGHQFKRNLLP